VFPGPNAFTAGDSVTLRGKASDQTGIKAVTINGTAAQLSNNGADWQLKVGSLTNGENTITVKAEDTLGQTQEKTITITRQIPLFAPKFTALDTQRNVFFLYDSIAKSIYSVDMATGARTLLAESKVGDPNEFTQPTSMIYDPIKDRLLLSQYITSAVVGFTSSYVGRIIAIDAKTGATSLFAAGAILIDISKPSLSLRKPLSLTIDPETRTLYVLDEKSGFIRNDEGQLSFDYAVIKYPLDVENPTFTRVSDNQINKDKPFLVGSTNLRYDTQTKQLITESQFNTEYNDDNIAIAKWFGVIGINTETGTRTSISGDNVHKDKNYLFQIKQPNDFYTEGGFAYYIDSENFPQRVLRINLSSGERSEWFSGKASDNKFNLRTISRLEYDTNSKTPYLLDSALKAVFKVEPQNNFKRTPITSSGPISEDTSLNYLSSNSIMWDKANNRLLVDNQLEGTINTYNLATGTSSILCNFGIKESTSERVTPLSSAIDTNKQRVVSLINYYFVENNTLKIRGRIDSCNLADGTHTIISDEPVTEKLPFFNPSNLVVDSGSQKAFLIDNARIIDGKVYQENSILQVDLTTGSRSEYAATSIKENPAGSLAFDSASGKLYLSQLFNSGIYSINPTTKAKELVSNNQKDASTLLLIPKLLLVDNNTLFTLDSGRQTLVSIAPDGKRTTRYSITTNGPNPINQIGGLLMDSENQRLFVSDQSLGVLALQDLVTGETIYLAK
jgi:hypothetical protein